MRGNAGQCETFTIWKSITCEEGYKNGVKELQTQL